ncbi:MAG: hypothetical protein KQH57_11205 [Actinomycetales bacterium]|nr:hypothetical protein [Actinomycetales bacterium]
MRTLLGAAEPDHSGAGIVLAAVSLVVMPVLSWAERRTGRELGSAPAVADSKQTPLCTCLSGALLVGLVAWRGDACCAPATVAPGQGAPGCTDGCCPSPDRH